MNKAKSDEQNNTMKHERNTFLFLTVFLAPILSVVIVSGFGFAVWISQILFGPPTV